MYMISQKYGVYDSIMLYLTDEVVLRLVAVRRRPLLQRKRRDQSLPRPPADARIIGRRNPV
jgi:hypothetical protein